MLVRHELDANALFAFRRTHPIPVPKSSPGSAVAREVVHILFAIVVTSHRRHTMP